MNLETAKNNNNRSPVLDDMDFDFRPITSGLGFHHPQATEPKSVVSERKVTNPPLTSFKAPKKEMSVYQSDLSLFYGQTQTPHPESKEEKTIITYRPATKAQRIFAYLTDLFLVGSLLSLVLTIMARTISMDLMDVWTKYPNEITPLVLTLFCGFYLIYFSIFEKAGQSTLGKNLFGLRVLSLENKPLTLTTLLLRTSISLLNFVGLGLFSYFDLQNKVTGSKVIRND